jgi:hypothetical protein
MGILKFKASQDGENTGKLLLIDEDGSPILASNGKQATFELRGAESKGFKEAKFKADKLFMDTLSGKNKKDNWVADLNRRISILLACFVGWENIEIEDGVPLEFTLENAAIILREESEIFKQVDSFIADRQNFVKKTTSV